MPHINISPSSGANRIRLQPLATLAVWCFISLALVSCKHQNLETLAKGSQQTAANKKAAKALPPGQNPDHLPWKSLQADTLHDPDGPAIDVLQQPADALRDLPRDLPGVGNQVLWVKALEEGYINPRTNVFPETNVNVLDLDILMDLNGHLPIVRFPHRQHTMWLDCSNCHNKIFLPEAGATPVTMLEILDGKYCGRCHGAVSFPLTQCARCHSVPHSKLKEILENSTNVVLARPKKKGAQ